MRWLFIILLVTVSPSCAGQVTSPSAPAATTPPVAAPSAPPHLPAPVGWVLYPSPSANDPALTCANYSRREWRVAADGESVKVSPDARSNHQDPLPPEINSRSVAVGSKSERHVIRVEDGWLVGLNAGEFGGALWWFGSDGKSSKRLGDENVVGFAESSKGVMALAGLAHMGSDSGKVLRITDGESGDRKVEALADLGAAPRAFAVESQDSLLIVTTRGLVRVRSSGAVEQLLTTNYGLLYPNSMTVSPSGVIHVGMRHFITRLTPAGNGYQEEWFVPADCTRFETRNYDCVCIPERK
jgi:hypothetical protein